MAVERIFHTMIRFTKLVRVPKPVREAGNQAPGTSFDVRDAW
jgi:hypothetical protein